MLKGTLAKDTESETTEQAIQVAISKRIKQIQHYELMLVTLKSKRAEMGNTGEDCINYFRHFIEKLQKEIALLESVLR
jgi:uncharacterized protein (UPF0212 family)